MSVTMLNLSFLTPKMSQNNSLHISESNGSNLAKSKNEHKQTNRQTNLATGSLIELLIAAQYFEKTIDIHMKIFRYGLNTFANVFLSMH